jgi:hypothetical protein
LLPKIAVTLVELSTLFSLLIERFWIALKRSDIIEYFLQSKGKERNTQIFFDKFAVISRFWGKNVALKKRNGEKFNKSDSFSYIIFIFNIIGKKTPQPAPVY